MFSRRPFLLRNVIALLILVALASPAAASRGQRRQTLEPSVGGRAADSGRLGAKERAEVFNETWETINDRYYDPTFNGVDWRGIRDRYRPAMLAARSDDDFYTVMKKMVGELRDAHTRFATPRERLEREQLRAVSAGVTIGEVEGRTVVVNVDADSDAARGGVEPGMIVTAIDDEPVAAKLQEARARVAGTSTERAAGLRVFRQLTDGEPGVPLRLTLERADGSRLDVRLMRQVVADTPKVTSRQLASGIGYIRLNLWKAPIHREFKRALESLRDAPGIIVDLRGNPGGEAQEVLKIAGYFFGSRVSFGQFLSRSGKSIGLFTEKDDLIYKGPVTILVNEGSGSGSELFSEVMQETNRATVIGRQSCGCVLGIARFKKLKGGSELAVSELKYVSPQGRKIEGTGVVPNRAVKLTLADLRRHHDATLEAAENALRSITTSTR